MRIESTDVVVSNTVRERWRDRLLFLASVGWTVQSMAKLTRQTVVSGLDATEVGLAALCMVLITASFIGERYGAPMVGVRRPGRPGTVVLGRGLKLKIDGRTLRFAREEIASGWTERSADDREDVVLQMRDGALVRWRARDEEEARASVQAAGVAPEHRAVTLRLGVALGSGGRIGALLLSFFVSLLGLIAGATGLGLALGGSLAERLMGLGTVAGAIVGMKLFVDLVLGPLVPSTVRIGTDGLVIARLRRRRFIPRASLRGVYARGNTLEISSLDGPGACLAVSSAAEAAIVARRIEEAMDERGGAAPVAAARLDRSGRPIATWLREVRAVALGASGYRDAALDREALCSVVEDGAAPAERRIAAAAALASDDEGKARARIAAQACADDRLRIAIEEATEDDVESARIEDALAVSAVLTERRRG